MVGEKAEAVLVLYVAEHLNGGGGQAALAQGERRLPGEQAGGARVGGMRLCDDGIAGGERGRKIASGNAVVSEGKIIRSQDPDGADGLVEMCIRDRGRRAEAGVSGN